jgi:ethanolamine ammonia-lyase small subunit
MDGATARGWSVGQPFAIHYCRVGILNDIGEVLKPGVAVLLIGERPGLTTAESLSAYIAFAPRAGHSDANRNLISNIHARGLRAEDAAPRILSFCAQIMKAGVSGFTITENRALPNGD